MMLTLNNFNNFVLWKEVSRNGKKTKVPFSDIGTPARANDPSTWLTLCEAMDTIEFVEGGAEYGLGFVLDGSFTAIDLDNCFTENGELIERYKPLLGYVRFCEYSPSGKGLHLIVDAPKPFTWCKKSFEDGSSVEVYDNKRFITITGNAYPGFDCDAWGCIEGLHGIFSALEKMTAAQPQTAMKRKPREVSPTMERYRAYKERYLAFKKLSNLF